MEIKTVPFREVSDDRLVIHKTCGDIISICYLEKKNSKQNIIKISKDFYFKVSDCYIDEDTDHLLCDNILEFKHNDNKLANIKYLRHICNNLRDMINANIVHNENALFLTLTYSQRDDPGSEPVPMRDTVRLYNDLKAFIKVLRKQFGSDIRYITACEPQRSGSWHAHVILIFNHIAPFIDNTDISHYWGQGFTFTQRIDPNIDNVGAYLTSYLTDMEVKEDILGATEKTVSIDGKKVKKKFVKGLRLSYYPLYFHPFRWSRNCLKPIIREIPYSLAKSSVNGFKMTYSKSVQIQVDDYSNVIQYEFYNRKLISDG